MQKIFVIAFLSVIFAAGPVIMQSQSSEYLGMLNRNASTDLDAVFFNPAGLAFREDGVMFTIMNQSAAENIEVRNDFETLSREKYTGNVSDLLLLSSMGMVKKGHALFSFGLFPIRNAQNIEYENGLPYMEIGTPDKPGPAFNTASADTIDGFELETRFESNSTIRAMQMQFGYLLNRHLAFSGGVRFLKMEENYVGLMDQVTYYPADDAMVYIPETSTVDLACNRSGNGLQFVFGAHYRWTQKLDISTRFETPAKILLKNDSNTNAFPEYANNFEFSSSLPGVLGLGLRYIASDGLQIQAAFTHYFSHWVENEELQSGIRNFFDLGFGVEYDINSQYTIRGGYTHNTGVAKDSYQRDNNFELSFHAFALGTAYHFNPKMAVNAGLMFVSYVDENRTIDWLEEELNSDVRESYARNGVRFALGFTVKLI